MVVDVPVKGKIKFYNAINHERKTKIFFFFSNWEIEHQHGLKLTKKSSLVLVTKLPCLDIVKVKLQMLYHFTSLK